MHIRTLKGFSIVWAVAILTNLAIAGGIIYIVWHFAAKYW